MYMSIYMICDISAIHLREMCGAKRLHTIKNGQDVLDGMSGMFCSKGGKPRAVSPVQKQNGWNSSLHAQRWNR